MKFRVSRTSDMFRTEDDPSKEDEIVELDTMQELVDFQKKCGCSLVFYGNSIEIYDDHRE